jgi:ATP-dependent Clp protease ATP-binding subunit ClpB
MELESVPTEIDEVQRRLRQLELAARQLAEETEDTARDRLAEIEQEIGELKHKEASLREQWEAEKLGMGDTQSLRRQLAELDHQFKQTDAAVKEKQAVGERVVEDDYQKLYDIDSRRRKLQQRLAELEAAGEEKKQTSDKRLLRQEVTEDEIAEVVSAWTGVPVSRMLETERAKLLVMEERIHQRVIGQDEAVEAVSGALRRSRAGLSDPDRPIGSFLFLGPTGVGKTELARALAEFMFDSEQAMVRIDMSEYMEKHAVARLIGAPPGYVGYEEGGQLTEAIRRRPYSVILLDEVEKAHADVFNVLLQIMDDGRLTDGQGRTVDFKNAVLIMTSNVGSQFIAASSSSAASSVSRAGAALSDKVREEVEGALTQTFPPEFLNRIDDVVIFHRLTKEDLAKIVEIQVERLAGRVRERGIEIELTGKARELLGNLGFDPVYGARPLKRVIQKQLVDKLALRLLEGEFVEGDTVQVDAADGELTFAKAKPAKAKPKAKAAA